MTPIRSLILIVAAASVAVSCTRRDEEVRRYKELTLRTAPPPAAQQAAMPGGDMASMSDAVTAGSIALEWTTPAGWVEKAGSGMRLATFTIEGSECTITAFPGDVGGDEANIRRWLGQLNVELSAEALSSFAANGEKITTAGGVTGSVFDFATAIPDGAPMSMLALVLQIEGQSAFVKWMGPPALLSARKSEFIALCTSLKPKSGS